MIVGGAVTFVAYPAAGEFVPQTSTSLMVVAGLLVGVGTRVGGGCTSGHGVCGMGRASIRGVAGTLIFMGVAFPVVYVMKHVVAS